MPKVRHTTLPRIRSARVKRMLNDRRFRARFAKLNAIRVDKSYDIPYVAGYSEDGRTVFVDRHLKTMMGKTDVARFIISHELTEKALLDLFNLDYQQAHHIATYVEHEFVTKEGVDWRQYCKFLDPQMKHIGHEKVQKIPKTLDIEPYQDEKDFHLLKRMKLHAR